MAGTVVLEVGGLCGFRCLTCCDRLSPRDVTAGGNTGSRGSLSYHRRYERRLADDTPEEKPARHGLVFPCVIMTLMILSAPQRAAWVALRGPLANRSRLTVPGLLRHFTAMYGASTGSRAAPCGAAPSTGTGRGVITPLNTERGGISG
ncbi:hypothetical protein KUCAC02_027486 [Chaenocephalus aceratus]|uniref:Uncharacterized protein n=1 Tax=Chaenocephalus aceratus TaxID=36190 RepID=A0ACB9W4I1_CHAAC|nr:hypothetical protein KUCAC02_027486 [Chaenocephalus aceratus]